jgi:hypothetical protein
MRATLFYDQSECWNGHTHSSNSFCMQRALHVHESWGYNDDYPNDPEPRTISLGPCDGSCLRLTRSRCNKRFKMRLRRSVAQRVWRLLGLPPGSPLPKPEHWLLRGDGGFRHYCLKGHCS